MKILIVKYERKNFFGTRTYTEDKKECFTKSDLVKAFGFFSKDHDVAIDIDNMTLFWDSMSDFENKTVSVRVYSGMNNYTEGKMPFEEIKKNFYIKFKKESIAA